jgi:hypothetical protein
MLHSALPFRVWFLSEKICLERTHAEAMLKTSVPAAMNKLHEKIHHTEMCEVSPNVNPSTGIYIYISRYF